MQQHLDKIKTSKHSNLVNKVSVWDVSMESFPSHNCPVVQVFVRGLSSCRSILIKHQKKNIGFISTKYLFPVSQGIISQAEKTFYVLHELQSRMQIGVLRGG